MITDKTYVMADRERYHRILTDLKSHINEIDTSTIPQLSIRNSAMNLIEELWDCAYPFITDHDLPDELSLVEAFCNQEQIECAPTKHPREMLYYSGICCEAEYVKEKIKEIRENRKK